jgi:replicative DNA helicase
MSELERKLLAKCLDPVAVKEAYDIGVRAELFEDPLYESIWAFTVQYWQNTGRESAPTEWALAQEFSGYVVNPADEDTEYLADRLLDRHISNTVQDLARMAAAGSVKTETIDPRQTLKEVYTRAYAAMESTSSRLTRTTMADGVEDRWDSYTKGMDDIRNLGATYGLNLLDVYTGGILPGELAVLAAFAKTGKTMFLLNAAVQALRQGYRPIVFTLELSLKDTLKRLDAMYSGVSYNRLTNKTVTDEDKAILRPALDELKGELGKSLMVERPEERTVVYLCSRAREANADYLIIDQLSKLDPGPGKFFNKKERYAAILDQLKADIGRPGKELPCLMAVQLRRGDDEPTEESFADAAEIERDCDIALALHRNQDMRNNGAMACDILLSRRTDLAKFTLEWELSTATRIRHMS